MDEIGFFQVVQHRGDGLAGSAGDIGNVLLGQAMFDQHFVTDAFAVFAGGFFQELDDPFPGIFKQERFEAALCFLEPSSNEVEYADGKPVVGFHEILNIGDLQAKEFNVLVHGGCKILPLLFAGKAEFAEQASAGGVHV